MNQIVGNRTAVCTLDYCTWMMESVTNVPQWLILLGSVSIIPQWVILHGVSNYVLPPPPLSSLELVELQQRVEMSGGDLPQPLVGGKGDIAVAESTSDLQKLQLQTRTLQVHSSNSTVINQDITGTQQKLYCNKPGHYRYTLYSSNSTVTDQDITGTQQKLYCNRPGHYRYTAETLL